MKTKLISAFLLSCLFQASLLHGQSFEKVQFMLGGQTKGTKVILVLSDDSVKVLGAQTAQVLKEIPYSEIEAATYSRSKHPRWKSGIGVALIAGIFAAPLFFMKGKKHWLTFQSGKDSIALRLHKKNYRMILVAVDNKKGLEVQRIIE